MSTAAPILETDAARKPKPKPKPIQRPADKEGNRPVLATSLPFAAPDDHDFVELVAPRPDYPSHFVVRGGRYFTNFNGRVFCPVGDLDTLLAEGCLYANQTPPAADLPASENRLPTYSPPA
jgi:hypothetical protein